MQLSSYVFPLQGVPLLLDMLVNALESTGMEFDGLYRVPGRASVICDISDFITRVS